MLRASAQAIRARHVVQHASFSTTRAAFKRKIGNEFYTQLRAKDPKPGKSMALEEELKQLSKSHDTFSDVLKFAAAITKPLPETEHEARRIAKSINPGQVFNAMLDSSSGASAGAKRNLVRAAALRGDAATALRIVDHLDAAVPHGADQQDYASLIEAQARRRDIAGVDATLARIRGRGLVPNHAVFLAAVRAFCHARELDRAFDLVDEMTAEGLRPTAAEYAALIEGCALKGEFQRGWDTYIFVRTKLFLLDVEAPLYNAMIKLCGRQGEPYKAAIFLDELRGKNLQATTETYENIMDAVARDAETAHRTHLYFKDMVGHGMLPTRKVFFALIHAAGTMGLPEQAEAYLDEMGEYGVRADGAMVAAALDAFRRSMRNTRAIARVVAVPATRPLHTTNRGILPLTQLDSGEVVPDLLGANAVHRSIAKIRPSDPAAREAGGVEEARLLGRGGEAWWQWRRRRVEALAGRLPADRVDGALRRLAEVADKPHYVWARVLKAIAREERARRAHARHEALIRHALERRARSEAPAVEAGHPRRAHAESDSAAADDDSAPPLPASAFGAGPWDAAEAEEEALLHAAGRAPPARTAAAAAAHPWPRAGGAGVGAPRGALPGGTSERGGTAAVGAGDELHLPGWTAGGDEEEANPFAPRATGAGAGGPGPGDDDDEYDYVYDYVYDDEEGGAEAEAEGAQVVGGAARGRVRAGLVSGGGVAGGGAAVAVPASPGPGGGAGAEGEDALALAEREAERALNERNLLLMAQGAAPVMRDGPHGTRSTDVSARRMETKAHDPTATAAYERYVEAPLAEQRLYGGGSPRLSRLNVEPDDEGEYYHEFGEGEVEGAPLAEVAFRHRSRVTGVGPAAYQLAMHERDRLGERHAGDVVVSRGSAERQGASVAEFRDVGGDAPARPSRAPPAAAAGGGSSLVAREDGGGGPWDELVAAAVGAPPDAGPEVFAPSWGEEDPLRHPTVPRHEVANARPQRMVVRRVDPKDAQYYEYYEQTVHAGQPGFRAEESEYDWGESTQEELEMAARMDELEGKELDEALVPLQQDHYVQQTVLDRRRLRHLDGTRKTVEELAAENRTMSPDTFHAVTPETAVRYDLEPLSAAQERLLKRLPALQQRYEEAEGRRDERLLSRVLGVLGSALRLRRAEATLIEYEVAHGVKPGRRTYDAVVRMFATAKRGAEAFAYKREMEARGLVPHEDTVGALVRLCAKQHDYETGLKLLREANERGIAIAAPYLELFRLRAQKAGIKSDLLPPDPDAWADSINAKLDKNKRKRSYAQASRKAGQMLSSLKR